MQIQRMKMIAAVVVAFLVLILILVLKLKGGGGKAESPAADPMLTAADTATADTTAAPAGGSRRLQR